MENDRQIVNKMVQKGVLVGDFDVMTVESSGTPVKESTRSEKTQQLVLVDRRTRSADSRKHDERI